MTLGRMEASILLFSALGVIGLVAGIVIALRLELAAARSAACLPGQESDLNKRTSLRTSCLIGLSTAAGGFAYVARDLVHGDAPWWLTGALLLGFPVFCALLMYVATRWVRFPSEVFLYRAKARNVMPAGGWGRQLRLVCMHCGRRSDELRREMATTGSFSWSCPHCGNVNAVPAASPCLTSASS